MGFPPGKTSPRKDFFHSGYALERQSSLREVIPGGNPTGMSYLYNNYGPDSLRITSYVNVEKSLFIFSIIYREAGNIARGIPTES